MKKAVIDVGTNSTRLLIGIVGDGKPRELVRITSITRLGENLSSTGKISVEAAERTCKTINRYARIAEDEGAEKISVFGTHAFREATNSKEILSYIKSRTGFEVKVITGAEEAYYSFKGATSEFGPGNKMVVDIGGGSTEISIGDIEPVFSKSVRLGCVTLTEAFQLDKAATEKKISAVRSFTKRKLSEIVNIQKEAPNTVIFTGGTATTLAAINLGLEVYDRNLVHMSKISRRKIEELAWELALLDAELRSKFSVIEKERLNVIAAGALILAAVLEIFGVEEAFVSESDILDGLLIYGDQ